MRKHYLIITLLFASLCSTSLVSAKNIDITTLGAKGDGITLNSQIIQKAIDDCAASGGGKVTIPAGTFLSGTVNLKNNVNLFLEQGAVLKGSTVIADYKSEGPTYALIMAANVHHISVTGLGTIDGNGKDPNYQHGEGAPKRPMLIFFLNCKEILVENVSLINPAFWTQKYMGCENVKILGISVYAHSNWNNDGIDMDSKNVLIANCVFDSNDDAICLKSERKEPCENVTITNCTAASNCNAIKFGTGSSGGFVNISVSNVVIHKASEDNIWKWQSRLKNIMNPNTVLAGIALESVDGGIIDHVNIDNITMKDVQTPIFLRLGSRHLPVGSLQNINIGNIVATSESNMCNLISGVLGYNVKNVFIHDLILINRAKGTINNEIAKISENPKGYPENRMFGTELPASGFFIRHAETIKLKNIYLQTPVGEVRPFLVADDVKNLMLDDVGIEKAEETPYQNIYHLRNVEQAIITPPAFLPNYNSLIYLEGHQTKNINLFLKDKEDKRKPASSNSEVKVTDVFKILN